MDTPCCDFPTKDCHVEDVGLICPFYKEHQEPPKVFPDDDEEIDE